MCIYNNSRKVDNRKFVSNGKRNGSNKTTTKNEFFFLYFLNENETSRSIADDDFLCVCVLKIYTTSSKWKIFKFFWFLCVCKKLVKKMRKVDEVMSHFCWGCFALQSAKVISITCTRISHACIPDLQIVSSCNASRVPVPH